MKRAGLLVLAVAVAGSAWAATSDPVYEVFRAQLQMQQQLVAEKLGELQDHQASLEAAWSRVDRLTADLVRAQQDHESLDSLRLRSQDLQQAESDLAMRLLEGQQLRLTLTETRAQIEQLRTELARLAKLHAKPSDPLSGTWKLTVEPGGQTGVLFLSLDGTLVTGTYALSGGWSGSMRGTLVSGKVRLERIDSQMGFSAVYYGRLDLTSEPARLEGTWEGTNLAPGGPAAGTWVATKTEAEEGQTAP